MLEERGDWRATAKASRPGLSCPCRHQNLQGVQADRTLWLLSCTVFLPSVLLKIWLVEGLGGEAAAAAVAGSWRMLLALASMQGAGGPAWHVGAPHKPLHCRRRPGAAVLAAPAVDGVAGVAGDGEARRVC
jgi:hypothetical protein